MGVLEKILKEIKEHDKAHPDHGVGCHCMDRHATSIRRLLYKSDVVGADKSMCNFIRVLGYITK